MTLDVPSIVPACSRGEFEQYETDKNEHDCKPQPVGDLKRWHRHHVVSAMQSSSTGAVRPVIGLRSSRSGRPSSRMTLSPLPAELTRASTSKPVRFVRAGRPHLVLDLVCRADPTEHQTAIPRHCSPAQRGAKRRLMRSVQSRDSDISGFTRVLCPVREQPAGR
jgi:hypothetical protein